MEILFVGIQVWFMRGLTTTLTKLDIVGYRVTSQNQAIAVAKAQPEISLVIFAGHLTIHSGDPLGEILQVEAELRKILNRNVEMVAATGHSTTDDQLAEQGCTITQKHTLADWLTSKVHRTRRHRHR